jgi:hypothetical protein
MYFRVAPYALALGLGFMLPAATAADDTTRIFTAAIAASEASKSKKFGINEGLGRAWVEVEMYHTVSESADYQRVVVPGLRYDRERSEVVFDADGQRVVCATVEQQGRWIFSHRRIEPTGACELTHRYVKVPVDNGFYIEHIEHFEVHFKPIAVMAATDAD